MQYHKQVQEPDFIQSFLGLTESILLFGSDEVLFFFGFITDLNTLVPSWLEMATRGGSRNF